MFVVSKYIIGNVTEKGNQFVILVKLLLRLGNNFNNEIIFVNTIWNIINKLTQKHQFNMQKNLNMQRYKCKIHKLNSFTAMS